MINELKILGLDENKAPFLELMSDLILDWNTKINVTALKNREDFLQKNIIDSLTLCKIPEFLEADNILDMGTGGGFPGLPLALYFPDKKFVLVDAVSKKLKVVADVAEKLKLSNVTVIHARAEDLAKDKLRESFSFVTSRAVANMSTLCEYCLPFVKIGGYFAAFKTRESLEEIEKSQNAIKLLGGKKERIVDDGIEGSGHIFVIVKKKSTSPLIYPRKAGTPLKEPL